MPGGAQRAMGEFGAVSVISGNIIGRTQTLTLYVEGAYKVLLPPHDLTHRAITRSGAQQLSTHSRTQWQAVSSRVPEAKSPDVIEVAANEISGVYTHGTLATNRITFIFCD